VVGVPWHGVAVLRGEQVEFMSGGAHIDRICSALRPPSRVTGMIRALWGY